MVPKVGKVTFSDSSPGELCNINMAGEEVAFSQERPQTLWTDGAVSPYTCPGHRRLSVNLRGWAQWLGQPVWIRGSARHVAQILSLCRQGTYLL
jgi:hypothetical protein